ncbi:MAG: pilus assembly protein [Gammaproteobacteria bacterium]
MDTASHRLRHFIAGFALSAALLPAIWSAPLSAANLSGADMIDYTAFPVTTVSSVTPKVMLVMSRDHQYFFKAYNDYSDLDGDGFVETTYDNSISYYGYFDQDKCYSYVEESLPSAPNIDYFKPKAFTTDHYCDAVDGEWSGNFLNWASMTRMDIVRKIVYGGRRFLDNPKTNTVDGDTILERALLPHDAHSFAKYYGGTDIPKLTPFNVRTDTTNGGNNDGVDNQDEGITICNSTFATSGQSQTTNERPLMRIVRGNFALWAAGEVRQCRFSQESGGTNNNDFAVSGIDAGPSSPSNSLRLGTGDTNEPDWRVQVRVCMDGLIDFTENNENCRLYPDGNYKPSGLIQEYGEEAKIDFGLFTGTYEKNISGGVLRKNPGGLGNEINLDTDGTFKADPNSATPSVGIIRALDVFKIWGWSFQNSRYFGSGSSDNCGFQLNSITEGECASWGNPMAEMYAEAVRYFAGLQPTAAFDANDNSYVGGLDEDDWEDPIDDDNWCAGINLVVVNSSLSSYDENTDHFTDFGAPDPIDLTNAVGDAEGFTGKDFLVGRIGAQGLPGNDEFCTAKNVTGLGEVVGVCPEGPTIDGTYRIAGMAHYAATHDIRPNLQGDQRITSYMVQLATNVPKFEIDTDNGVDSDGDGNTENDADVTILPAYRLAKNDGGGTLVDFKIVQTQTEVNGALSWADNSANPNDIGKIELQPGSGVYGGKAIVQWEDSEQGGDFDKDVWGTISYRYDPVAKTVEVATDVVDYQTNNAQLFGFIISGTTQDGFHAYSGGGGSNSVNNGAGGVRFVAFYNDQDVTLSDCDNDPFENNSIPGTTQKTAKNRCESTDPPRSFTFTIDGAGASAGLLPDPLLLAAKYGGFIDSNGNDLPDLPEEYDIRDTSGTKVPGGDGIPDTYFFVTNPSALEDALRAVFDQVIERVASGTAAAVVANSQEGTGAVFQALYDPVKSDNLGNEATWMGTLHSLFVDPAGFLREDSNGNDKLDNYNTDKVIEIFFDEDLRRSRVKRFGSESDDEFIQNSESEDELNTLKPIWNAREQLSLLSDVTTQRSYSDTADNGRFIFTWLDTDRDGIVAVDGSETFPFTASTFNNSTFGWVDAWDGFLKNDSEADKLVNYIRGQEQAGYRNRTVDYDADGTAEVIRLGDIVHSTPTVEGTPRGAFDLLALDDSYTAFRAKYLNRRNVVYVGANDGMLHAFNAGFFDVTDSAFKTKLTTEIEHPLGSELWAYIPKNLLGHLQWLADEDYTHVFYVDQKPLTLDVKIFDDDTTHPGGWGTILVVGMRLGGGHDNNGIVLDTTADGVGGANAADDVLTKSAYAILDVTDPEQPPTVIAEISPPGQFFTTSAPVVVNMGEALPSANANPPNKWYLVFGSGPTNLGTASSSQTAKIFAYDLRELYIGNGGVIEDGPFNDEGTPGNGIGYIDTGEANTFAGDFTAADQDLDMKVEAIYFGTVGNESGTGGSFYRMSVKEDPDTADWNEPFKLLNVNQPFSTRASITIDNAFRTWLFAGTGRHYTNNDKNSAAQQTLYGFIDPYASSNPPNTEAPVDHTQFEPVAQARTFTNGDVSLDGDVSAETTFDAFAGDVEAAGGWYFDFDVDGTEPSERIVSNPTLIGGILLATPFTPATDQCGAEGSSREIGRAFNSGLVPEEGIFGTEPCQSCPDGVYEAIGDVNLGAGQASSVSIFIGAQTIPGVVTGFTQSDTGAITNNEISTMGGIRNGEISWQEFRSE